MIKKLVGKPTLEQIIAKGGAVASENTEKSEVWIKLMLRIKKELADAVKVSLAERIGMSQNAWILEAIQEKIKRENVQ